MLQGFKFMMQIANPSAAGDGFVDDRAALHLFYILPKVADSQLSGDRDFSLVGLLFSDDHAEKGRLAGAIWANQADLLPRIQLKEASTKTNCFPYCLFMFAREIISKSSYQNLCANCDIKLFVPGKTRVIIVPRSVFKHSGMRGVAPGFFDNQEKHSVLQMRRRRLPRRSNAPSARGFLQ
jgi:hypothetical protein